MRGAIQVKREIHVAPVSAAAIPLMICHSSFAPQLCTMQRLQHNSFDRVDFQRHGKTRAYCDFFVSEG